MCRQHRLLPKAEVEMPHAKKGPPPLIVHFDINKTLILKDSVTAKSTEFTIREIVADQFWGTRQQADDGAETWTWDGNGLSVDPCTLAVDGKEQEDTPISYLQFCRQTIPDREACRSATTSFGLVNKRDCRRRMTEAAEQATSRMAIPLEHRDAKLENSAGLKGHWRNIFPAFFRSIADLQRQGRDFAIFFRSFGADFQQLRKEWNSFCEMRHPLYSHLLEGFGPMDGSVPGIPDRRLHDEDIHTVYRDSKGPLIVQGSFSSGAVFDSAWDSWGRSNEEEDTRGGRRYFKDGEFPTVQGYADLQRWFLQQQRLSKTHILKEDFAWWHHNGGRATAGKLLIGIEGVHQVFFDDNIGAVEPRVVDARSASSFTPVRPDRCLGTACIRVDPLQAMSQDDYFINSFAKSLNSPDALWSDNAPQADTPSRRTSIAFRGPSVQLPHCPDEFSDVGRGNGEMKFPSAEESMYSLLALGAHLAESIPGQTIDDSQFFAIAIDTVGKAAVPEVRQHFGLKKAKSSACFEEMEPRAKQQYNNFVVREKKCSKRSDSRPHTKSMGGFFRRLGCASWPRLEKGSHACTDNKVQAFDETSVLS